MEGAPAGHGRPETKCSERGVRTKDPLLIYKFEGFEAFKTFVTRVNEETISFLMKAEIPIEEPERVQEARAQKRQRYSEQKMSPAHSCKAAAAHQQPHKPNRNKKSNAVRSEK